jgi:hypothetical protein
LDQTDRNHSLDSDSAALKIKGDYYLARKCALSRGVDLDEGAELGRGAANDLEQGTIAKSRNQQEQGGYGKENYLDSKV